ncbi:peptide deformylase [Celerinatantimonas diazotrophica]|uniref:Peptide deformylase n=1 Tax=Celerinatantimonas diazotrophica TaxID=412034 RepID=A0A4R1J785_9GAMM|nr:peptide deformylase [Celerinatantimonas diazotrophica]TCK46310.1 peptide deformylase [Celerinatantimonas diazotrophica]CAG9295316.1 Peptide deformylase [Celerinatantimonas diazotrophica]
MAVLNVLRFPDERLRTIAKPVVEVTPKIQQIVDDMFDTMYAEDGVGLAATQVDIHQQIIVMDCSETRDQRIVLINPELIERSPTCAMNEEGCLSVPEYRAEVERSTEVTVKALDRDGNSFQIDATGLLAICIQHEMDHLKGKLFVDYLSPLKRQRVKQKMEKLAKREARSRD